MAYSNFALTLGYLNLVLSYLATTVLCHSSKVKEWMLILSSKRDTLIFLSPRLVAYLNLNSFAGLSCRAKEV